MEEYYFNFSENLGEQNGTQTVITGQPRQEADPETGLMACFFDGQSAIELPFIEFENKNFTIECIFRNLQQTKEQGVFGSNGFRLAYRSNRGALSYTFWANFPSSVSPKRILNDKKPEAMNSEHYIAITRKGNTFNLYDNGEHVGTLDYQYNYWRIPVYIGYYYDLIYGFHGYIREFKISMNKVLVPSAEIPKTLRGQTNYELG